MKNSIRIILNHIMTKDVQKQLSWSGKGTKKISFELKYKRIVIAMNEVLKEKFMQYNYDDLKKKVSTLLSGA